MNFEQDRWCQKCSLPEQGDALIDAAIRVHRTTMRCWSGSSAAPRLLLAARSSLRVGRSQHHPARVTEEPIGVLLAAVTASRGALNMASTDLSMTFAELRSKLSPLVEQALQACSHMLPR
jgi:hypothetical protein